MVNIAQESPAVTRSRRKLMEQWKEEAKANTPEKLQELKKVIAEQMARTNEHRVPVPGKGLSLFTPKKMVVTSGVSSKVQAVMEKLKREMNQTAPVA